MKVLPGPRDRPDLKNAPHKSGPTAFRHPAPKLSRWVAGAGWGAAWTPIADDVRVRVGGSMLRNTASKAEIRFRGRISAGCVSGEPQNRSSDGPKAGRRTDFADPPIKILPKSCPETRFQARKHYCVSCDTPRNGQYESSPMHSFRRGLDPSADTDTFHIGVSASPLRLIRPLTRAPPYIWVFMFLGCGTGGSGGPREAQLPACKRDCLT